MRTFTVALLLWSAAQGVAFTPHSPICTTTKTTTTKTALAATQQHDDRRRSLLAAGAALATSAALSSPAWAGIDMNALKALPVEGDTTGVATRKRQIELDRNRPEDTVDQAYVELPSGVSYREYRDGKGTAVVGPGATVACEMTIRCKSFATDKEPGGLKYFDSKVDTEFNEVAFVVGMGEILPGLEEGMAGMHKGALRRIQVPTTMVYAAKKAGQLPLPAEKNKDANRRFASLFKTDATLLFEVLVTRVKEAPRAPVPKVVESVGESDIAS